MSTATDKPSLPIDVIQAIENGQKIEAIKRLRETAGIGLKEAKDMIDAYEDNRPAGSPPLRRGDRSNGGLIVAIVLSVLGYAVYRFFS